jgi:hypothetical protein
MKIRLCSLLLLILIGHSLSAQTINGKLSDNKTKAIIPFASLSLIDLANSKQIRYTSSDTLGNFVFNQVPIGKYLLTMSFMGYQKFQKEINLTAAQSSINLGNLLMAEDTNLLNTITITGGTPNFSTTNGVLKIGIAGNPFFKSAASLTDVLRKLPGLQVNSDGTMLLSSRAVPTLFVDGKPLHMNADEIQAYLSSLSPEMVESIEMINQPSSKYDGQYQGIIDVKLKRNLNLGLKGAYNLRFQQNTQSLLDNNLSLNYKTKKFAHSFNLGHTTGNTYYRYHALQYLANSNAMVTDTKTIVENQNYNIQARVGYEPKTGRQFEAFFRTYQINRNGNNDNALTTLNNALSQTIALQGSENTSRPKQHNYAGGVNYDAQFKTSELHIVTALAQIDNRQNEDIQNSDRLSSTLLSYWKTNARNNILIRTAQADYTQRLTKGKLEFGAKYAFNTTSNKLRYDTLGSNGFELDPGRSNEFSYSEYIAAGYLSFSGNKGKFNYSLGLRAEHTKTLANSITTNNLTERDYLKWLPSANLTFAIQKNQQLSLSYSQRLSRPSFDMLNPFRFYYSPRHYWIGNPDLQPSTTNLFSLAYSVKALNISLNAGRENDPMVRYPQYDPVTNILAFMGNNLPYRDFVNIQINMPITITNWWKASHNLALYYNKELRPYFGQTFQIPVYNYTLNGSQVFTLKKLIIDLSYNYESKSGNSLYVFAPVYTLDIAIQRPWLNNRINAKLALQDLFYGGKRRIIFREKAIMNNDFYHDLGTRRLVFSLSYNFGSSTYKQRESKKSEEETRAGR